MRPMLLWVAAALAVIGGPVVAQPVGPDLWRDIQPDTIARPGPALATPRRFRALSLDLPRFEAALAAAPSENDVEAAASPFIVELPLPEGGFARFRVVESPIMAPELAARFPGFRTYLGQGVDDPSATARFDLTAFGLRAQVLGWRGALYIEPAARGNTAQYLAFRKADLAKPGERMRCAVTGEEIKDLPDFSKRNVVPKVSSGATRRVYRVAIAATGEYTAAFGGTVADGMSGIVTTLNRVNGLYEREVAVRMVLVANNDLIVYTNAATDPYANTSADLAANQSNITAVIGSANFDIGHLVGTGGGGVAGLGVVCSAANKARGLTGSSNPTGDAFDVDYVAHEMGHQFAGNHTFNGSGGSCAGGNRNASTAYEPGSGITIQAYAGICGADNTQPNSEDYFHRLSLNEILNFTAAGCATQVATGNTPPVVTILPGNTTSAAFAIPARTPFELVASGSDADPGDAAALTYVWEQFDLGAANTAGALVDNGGPLFRSFDPSPSPRRVFPSLRYILNNANVPPAAAPLPGTTTPNWFTAELLPSTSRTMNFRVTVRDNRAGGGGTNEAAAALTVVSTAGPFAITAPNAAFSVAAGGSIPVTWDVANTTVAPISASSVAITLSLDGGNTFPVVLAASTPNDGSETVSVPAGTAASTQARIRVAAVGNVFFDLSAPDFTVTAAPNTAPTINVTGSVATQRGSPTASADVATVADGQDAAAQLSVAVLDAPPELAVSASNNNGTIRLSATASCTLVAPTSGGKTYPVLLRITDTAGASTTAPVNVLVGNNDLPTLGAYGNVVMTRSSSATATPAQPIADANGNLVAPTITPATLPGSGAGATLSIAANGTVTLNTDATTTLGTYAVTAQANDSCGAVRQRTFNVTIASPNPVLGLGATQVVTGNGLIEPNECNQVNVTLSNVGGSAATGVSGVLSTSTPGVTITQPNAAWPDIPAGATRTSSTPFQISTAGSATCFSNISLSLTVSFGGGGSSPTTLNFSLPIGQAANPNYVFTSAGGAMIPAGGTLVAGSNVDDALVSLTTPFAFNVYGTAVAAGATVRASTNGNLQFTAAGGAQQWSNGALPSAGTGDVAGESFPANAPVLFPWWDDLQLAVTGGGIYTNTVGTAPNRQFIVEWRGRTIGDGATTVNLNFAIVLAEGSDTIEYRYVTTGAGSALNGAGATVGAQAATTGTLFTQFSLNQAVVTAGRVLTGTRAPAVCSAGSGVCAVGGPTQLQFQQQPTNAAPGVALSPAVTVRILDAGGALVGTSTANVTVALGSNPGAATLGGTTTVAAVGGVASFGNLTLSAPGNGYTLVASSPTLAGATSNAFNINAPTTGTTTTIVSDNPDPSVVGQPYTVVVDVASASATPTGTISVRDGTGVGSATCGPVALAPNGANTARASCAITGLVAGSRTLTADYAPSGAFSASSATASHAVNAAATTVSVTGPARARVGTAATYTATLGVAAPGAGTPTGTVTMSAGASSCQFSVPTATPSCAITFTSTGARTVSAGFAPSDSNFTASSSSGAGNASTVVFAQSDVNVTKTNGVAGFLPGDAIVYTIVFGNAGPDAAASLRVRDDVPAALGGVTWTCVASGGATCPAAAGAGAIDSLVPTLPASGTLTYTFTGSVVGNPAQISNTAFVELPADTTVEDLVPGNNSATDVDLPLNLFSNGFEPATVAASTGELALASMLQAVEDDGVARVLVSLDDVAGTAAHLFARRGGAQVELLLVLRGADGQWQAQPWRVAGPSTSLRWSASPTAAAWRLQAVALFD